MRRAQAAVLPLLTVSLVVAWTPGPAARMRSKHVRLNAVHVVPGADGLQLEVTATGQLSPRPTMLRNPERLVLNFPNTVVREPRKVAVRNKGVDSVRVAQNTARPPVVRLVVFLTGPHRYELVPSGSGLLVKLWPVAATRPGPVNSPAFGRSAAKTGPRASPLAIVPLASAAAIEPPRATATRPGAPVGCLGRIEPQGGVLHVTGSYLEGRPQRVRELKVTENDLVHSGQLLAVLDGKDQLEKAVRVAEARVELARSRLEQVKAGASASDIAVQTAQVGELKAALQNARTEYQRYEILRQKTDVSSAELDARRLAVETTEQKLAQAEGRLKSISEVRPTDVAVAESELGVAQAELARARAQLRTAVVFAPVNGRVLAIHAAPGEEIGPPGLLDLAQIDPMYVEAEVYETDIARVHVGQQAFITSDLFSGRLSGRVERVGTALSKNDILPLDPVSFADARVFKVRIRLEKGSEAASFINGKVSVVIQP